MDHYKKIPLSRKFEYLIKDLLKLELGLQESDMIVTQMTRDGGRDVEFEIKTITHILPRIKDKVWIEAKLRNTQKVQLNEIAGNIIIATNSNVHKIYFVSNHYFSNQTISELVLLRLRTGLSIVLIDGYQVKLLIEYWRNELSQHSDIIDKLNLPCEKDSTIQNIDLSIDLENYQLCRESSKKQPIPNSLNLCKEYETKKIINIDHIGIDTPTNDIPAINKAREILIKDIISDIKRDKIIFLKGNEGHGKSFVLSKVSSEIQKDKWIVHRFEITPNDTIISFTQNVIIKISNIDYIKIMDVSEELLIQLLTSTFDISSSIASEILNLLTGNLSYGNIPAEICGTLIFNLVSYCRNRKRFLLVIDDIHKADDKLYPFLINLCNKFSKANISVLASADYRTAIQNKEYIPKHFVDRTLEDFSYDDLVKFIELTLPGANKNVIDLIHEKALPIPSNIKIFIDYLINLRYVESVDDMYFIVNNIKNTDINWQASNAITNMISQIYSNNKTIWQVAICLYLFNNKIDIRNIRSLIEDIDEQEVFNCPLFRYLFENNICYFTFKHELYLKNTTQLLNGNLFLQRKAYDILEKYKSRTGIILSPDTLGNLYEHVGDYANSYIVFMNYGKQLELSDPKRAISMYTKALDNYLFTFNKTLDPTEHQYDELFSLVFSIMRIYDKLNMLACGNVIRLYDILERYKDNGILNGKDLVLYLYYSGQRETKLEHFSEAQRYFKDALSLISKNGIVDEQILYMVNIAYGIDLKHLGRRKESILFFDNLYNTYGAMFRYERESNMAAYYLSLGDYEKALSCYRLMKQQRKEREIHLDIDFAMTYFYMNRYDDALSILNEVIPLSYDTVNLSETARAYNIKASIYWMMSEYKIAENYFDKANAVGELSNNYRWLWRIRINQAQVALQNGNIPKAKNICYNIIDHLSDNEDSIVRELSISNMHSKRYSALKAVCLIFDKIGGSSNLKYLYKHFPTIKDKLQAFTSTIRNPNHDETDPNFYKTKGYIILG